MRKTEQVNGIPIRLLNRGTVVTAHHDSLISLTKNLTGECAAFECNFLRIYLSKNLTVDFETDGPRPEGWSS